MGEAPSTKIHLQTNVTYMNRWFLFAADSWCAWVNYHAFFSGEGSKGEGWKKCKIDEQCKEVALDSFDKTKQRQLILCNWSIKEKKNKTKTYLHRRDRALSCRHYLFTHLQACSSFRFSSLIAMQRMVTFDIWSPPRSQHSAMLWTHCHVISFQIKQSYSS